VDGVDNGADRNSRRVTSARGSDVDDNGAFRLHRRRRAPAGDYIVTEMSQDGMVSIASKDRERTAFVLTVRAVFDRKASTPELVFERFGGQNFLSQIIGEGRQGREILLAPEIMERELQRVALEEKR
jgi:hypothetical protein